MENPVRYMSSDDNKMKKTLGETGGLGTVATRADIIEKLFHSFLLEKKGNEILLTSKGKQLLELVPEEFEKTGAYRFLGNGTCQDCQRSTQRTGIYQRYRKHTPKN